MCYIHENNIIQFVSYTIYVYSGETRYVKLWLALLEIHFKI